MKTLKKGRKLLSTLLAVSTAVGSLGCMTAVAEEDITPRIVYIEAGQLTAGDWWDAGGTVTLEQARSNALVIQEALDTLGQSGGGTVVLPEGTYCIAGDYKTYETYCLYIRYDNLTLRGAGKEGDTHRTVLKANSHWNAAAGTPYDELVYRNSGIRIEGLDFNAQGRARKNITLEGFELDGCRGWSNASDWGYDPTINYGWDVNHKGITVAHDKMVHNVRLHDINIHSFSGETLYVGGQLVGYLEVTDCIMADTNASCFNLYAAWLNVQNCQFGSPDKNCRFWIEYCPRAAFANFDESLVPESFPYEKNTAYFAGNTFYNSRNANGIALAQGDCSTYTLIFEKNYFDNKNGQPNFSLFQMAGAIYGPVYIRENTFHNTRGPVLNFAFGGAGTLDENGVYGDWSANKNIYLENNVGTDVGGDYIIDMCNNFNSTGSQPIENLVIRGNHFTAKESRFVAVGVGGTSELKNVLIEGNTFVNCVEPKETSPFVGNVPLFRNNTYEKTSSPEVQLIDAGNTLISPFYEKLYVRANGDTTASLCVGKYEDGHTVTITIAKYTAPVTFAANAPSLGYELSQDYVLKSGDTLTLKYDAARTLWVLADGQ